MFAPQNQEPDIIDAWSGTLQDWYDSIDNALTVSEIIPGNYEYSTATSYGNVGDINEGDSTFVDVHTHSVCVPYYKAAPYNISHTKIFSRAK